MPDSLEQLIEKFRSAGCKAPEGWAYSEFEEGIAQYARFIFLRELWKCAIPLGSRDWLSNLELQNDDGEGGVKRRLKESSVSIDDLTALVRAAQVDVIRKVAYLLDGYAPEGGHVDELTWQLFELDDNFQPRREIAGLHESVDDEIEFPADF